MKKYLLAILLTALVILTGCQHLTGKTKGQTDISSFNNISARFTAAFGEVKAAGDFSYSPEGLGIVLSEPKTLSSLKMSADKDGVSFSFKSVEIKKGFSTLTERFYVSEIYSVLNNARLYGKTEKREKEKRIVGENYSLTLDENNRVTLISIPEKDIEISLDYGE